MTQTPLNFDPLPPPEDEQAQIAADLAAMLPYEEQDLNELDAQPVGRMASALRTLSGAMAWARNQESHPTRNWYRCCLIFAHECWNAGARYPTATAGYFGTQYRHTSWPPPPGALVWWTNSGAGHVAFSRGGGWCDSNDFKRRGMIDTVLIKSITAGWGAHYRGWSEDVNGVRVLHYSTKPRLDLSELQHALRSGKTIRVNHGLLFKKALRAEVGAGRMSFVTDRLGFRAREQYALWQKKYLHEHLNIKNVSASDIDGVPGQASLQALASRHGLDVQA